MDLEFGKCVILWWHYSECFLFQFDEVKNMMCGEYGKIGVGFKIV